MSASSKKKLRKEQNAALLTERQQKEQAEAKSLKRMTVGFVAVMALILVTFLITQAVGAVNRSGIIEKNTIAATVGEHQLNSIIMNYYFRDAVTADYNEKNETYGDYTDSYFQSLGLDLTKPLNEQVYNKETGETWADYYMEEAVKNAQDDYALYDLAQADKDFTLPESDKANIDSTLMNLQFYAAFSGASDVDQYLRIMYGNGANEENFREYCTVGTTAAAYYNAHMEALDYSDEDIRAYEKDRYNNYSAYSFASYYLANTSFYEGGTTDENGTTTYSDEEKEAGRVKAEAIAKELAGKATVEELDAAIAALDINKDKETPASSTKNTDVMHTTLYEKYAEWLSSADRKEGDTTVLPNATTSTDADGKETEVINGYYVLFFQERNDSLEHLANVRHILINYEGGTKDDQGNTTYSDEEKAAAKKQAEELLDKWKNNEPTEESFIALVKDNTDDTASAETGGLYEDIHRESQYMENFRAWAIDASRKPGDTGIVESDYGYHIMYFSSWDELTFRDFMIQNELTSNDMESWMESLQEATKAAVADTSKINLDLVYSQQ